MGVLTVIEISGELDAVQRKTVAAHVEGAAGGILLRIQPTDLPKADLGQGAAASELAALCRRIETHPAPVVAILSGPIRGAGFELALAASARVATHDADFSFDDAGIGLVPPAGATQRLPRLVGGAEALRLLQGGVADAPTALATGLVDALGAGDGTAEAVKLVAIQPERKGLRDGRSYLAAVAAARSAARTPVAARITDCVEAALMLPLEQGLSFERVCFDDLCASDGTQGLIHARRAFAVAAGRDGTPVERIGIWGAGERAVAIAQAALRAGLVVQFAAAEREAVVKALADIAGGQEADVQSGALAPDAREAEWARLLPQVGVEGLAGVDLTVLTEAAHPVGPCLAYGPAIANVPQLTLFDTLAEISAQGAAPDHLSRAVGFARALGWVPVVTATGGPVSLRLATALAESVAWAEAQGYERSLVAQSLAAQGIAGEGKGQATAPDEIALRCLAALANAGAGLLAEGAVPSATHIDAVALAAGLMARWTGGPMYQASRRGLLVLRRDLRLWAADDPALWSPAALIDDLVSEGRGFI